MRTREQRRAARSARGWPRLRVHAVRNGVGAVILGALLLWVTHGPLRFQNFPADDVAWAWRVIALVVAVLLPYVLLAMGAYLLLAGFLATNSAALAAGRARTVMLEPEDPEDPPVTTHRLPEHAPPGVRIRAHTMFGRHHDSRYTRELLGLLPVQSPVALAPLGVGIVALIAASIYYSTGYAKPAAVLLLGVLYLGWKLFRGWRSHRVYSDTPLRTPRENAADSVPDGTSMRYQDTAHHPVTRESLGTDDHAVAPYAPQRATRSSDEIDDTEEPYETTDELPVIERIRDRYTEPRRMSASQRRLAERAEREAIRRRLPRVVEAERADTSLTTPSPRVAHDARHTDAWDAHEADPQGEAAKQEQQRLNQKRYEDHMQRHRDKREDRLRNAEARQPEEAPSLWGYAKNRFMRRGDDS